MIRLQMLLKRLPMSVPRATSPGRFRVGFPQGKIHSWCILVAATKLIPSLRDTETFESVTEDDQLPQIVEELHDVHVSPGAPITKMQLKVKGMFMKQYK